MIQMKAIFEGGVLRPITPLPFDEQQEVTLFISEASDPDHAHFFLSPEKWDEFIAALDAPPKKIPALIQLLHS